MLRFSYLSELWYLVLLHVLLWLIGIVVTNDGNAILRELDLAHPAAKVGFCLFFLTLCILERNWCDLNRNVGFPSHAENVEKWVARKKMRTSYPKSWDFWPQMRIELGCINAPQVLRCSSWLKKVLEHTVEIICLSLAEGSFAWSFDWHEIRFHIYWNNAINDLVYVFHIYVAWTIIKRYCRITSTYSFFGANLSISDIFI